MANQDDPSSENGESTANGQPKGEPSEGEIASAMSCALCGLSFTSIQDQRAHVRSDLHGYNLKQKLRGLKPVEEKEFDRLVGGEPTRQCREVLCV